MAVYNLDVSSIANLNADITNKLTAAGVYLLTKFSSATKLVFTCTRCSQLISITNGNTVAIALSVNGAGTLNSATTIMSFAPAVVAAALIITPNVLIYTYRTAASVVSIVIGTTSKGYQYINGCILTSTTYRIVYDTYAVPASTSFPNFGGVLALDPTGAFYLESPIHISDALGVYFGTLVDVKFITRVPVSAVTHYVIGNDVLIQGSSLECTMLVANGAI